MSKHEIQSMFDALMNEDLPTEERAAFEAQLDATPEGRKLLSAYHWIHEPPAIEEQPGIGRAVMASIPGETPGVYRQIAEIVLRAWSDVELRSTLRGEPRATIESAGLRLSPDLRLEVVGPDDGRLPTSESLFLPLPDADAPAVDTRIARRRLGHSEFGWLFGPPWQRGAVPTSEHPLRSILSAFRGRGGQSGQRRLAYAGVLAAILLVALNWSALTEGLSGTVVEGEGGLGLPIAVGLALLVGAVWMALRKGR